MKFSMINLSFIDQLLPLKNTRVNKNNYQIILKYLISRDQKCHQFVQLHKSDISNFAGKKFFLSENIFTDPHTPIGVNLLLFLMSTVLTPVNTAN